MNMMAPLALNCDAEAIHRLGEMLWSAIRHGGLLAERDWPRWLHGIQDGVAICGTLVSVELPAIDGHSAGRWFADPITAVLILRWHRNSLTVPAGVQPTSCLAVALAAHGEELDGFVQRARHALELRAPGLLVAYATGAVPAATVHRSTWERVVYGFSVPDEPIANAPPTNRRERTELSWSVSPELKALRDAGRTPDYARAKNAAVNAKASAATALASLPVSADPIRAALRGWAAHALRSEGGGRVSLGYAPSTVASYLRALASIFDGWTACPFDSPATAIEGHVASALAGLPGRAQSDAVKALLSFERFANAHRAEPINFDLDDFVTEQVGSADLVLPEAYERAGAMLRRQGDKDAADVLALMFRAGLRLAEVLALRAGDVATSGDMVELIVEANDERALKTKTSRRILPLDALLEVKELHCLVERASQRQAESLQGAEGWLFGPTLSVSPPKPQLVAQRIDNVLRIAAGSDRIGHNHLRHSFASYLLATLLLPPGMIAPAVPPALTPVVSPARFRRVADRLLGQQRLGAGAIHAVSQLMGHTGPETTLRHYCHLLDLSLGLYCSRPSSLPQIDGDWLITVLGVTPEARRKAGERAKASLALSGKMIGAAGPLSPSAILSSSPDGALKRADEQLLSAAVKRLGRELGRAWTASMLEVEAPRRRRLAAATAKPKTVKPSSAFDNGIVIEWQRITRGERRADLGFTEPATPELARFVDKRLRLTRRPRCKEREALWTVVARFKKGRHDIRLHRLRDAEAFVRLLCVMGFQKDEVELKLTSVRARGMVSSDVHRFLEDRAAAPHLSGRIGWRGSLLIRLRPTGLGQPILTASAVRFTLAILAEHLTATAESRLARG